MMAGERVHVEIGARALDNHLLSGPETLPYVTDLYRDERARAAFYCGCMFPDWGHNGLDDEASEVCHWAPFQVAYSRWVTERYPPPWLSDEAKCHVAFFFGILTHGAGDLLWHFGRDGEKSLLEMTRDLDGVKHHAAEVAGEVFSHWELPRKNLGGRFWWACDAACQVLASVGVSVAPGKIETGCHRTLEHEWKLGARVGWLVYPYHRLRARWLYAHYQDYEFGGIDSGAALAASWVRQAGEALHGRRTLPDLPEEAPGPPVP